MTTAEIEAAAKLAWKNETKCIGRLFWDRLVVRDLRHLARMEEIASACFEHLTIAFNGGNIIPLMSVFRPGTRILNHELVGYAGYGDGVGDPMNRRQTLLAETIGWTGEHTDFDVLPLMIQREGGLVFRFDIPKCCIKEVDIRDAELPSLEKIKLRWPAVPILSDMDFVTETETFSGAPFNGWFMATEIGARNLADTNRYNLLPVVATDLGLDTSTDQSLWKDEAIVKLTRAVYRSFRDAGVMIVDHHTAAKQFEAFARVERGKGCPVHGDWNWLIPPVSPAATEIWHDENLIPLRTVPEFRYRPRTEKLWP